MEFYSEFGVMCSSVSSFGNISESVFEVHPRVQFLKKRQFPGFIFQNPQGWENRINEKIFLNSP